ncbi:tRNA lysidine(34) synthetase TilS [Salinibacter grassmerensis]|uniref:tRNA lysidine(34) synthetase TilS n=1 Tax=Salinibacter grassmerensis TaxID=3040353 RepID=UPI0021E833BA|nr:tRNA lysidine(34) synthetase TilS [Salinibacter grassmerensis]
MSHPLVDTVAAFSDRHALLDDEPVLVAVSGGVDSMTCLSVLRRRGIDVHALHANYGLREGADADEALVRRWCTEQSPPVPLSVVALDAKARAASHDESLQEAARRLRYDALATEAAEIGAPAVATGHHRNDQAETLLLNLVRGSGPEGLAGMRPARPLEADPSVTLVRPLLNARRDAIESYAESTGLPWRTDPTNQRHDYDRGVVRTDILPRLESHFEGATDALARSADLMQEYVDQALRPALRQRMTRTYTDRDEGGALSVEALREAPPVWRRRLLLEALRRALPTAPYSRAVAEELEALVEAQVGKRVEVGAGTVWRERGQMRFVPDAATPDPLPPTSVEWGTPVSIPQGRLRVARCDEQPSSLNPGTPHVAYADADRLGTTLTVRSWADGDRIRPLGLDGTKPVSDLLTEARVPPHRRMDVSVLCGDGRIAWVVGHRLDHRVRVRPATDRVARLILRPREKPSDN